MTAVHQMGYDSDNLLDDPQLGRFSAAIVSPVNYTEDVLKNRVIPKAAMHGLELIFDPQLYYPQSERSRLRSWSYFPSDFDTADISSLSWWSKINHEVVSAASRLKMNRACSPAFVPRVYQLDYYAFVNQIGNEYAQLCAKEELKSFLTVIINLSEIADSAKCKAISSIVSQTRCTGIYLVFVSDTPPRQEYADADSLKGAMKLISDLSATGLHTLVGFCSSDAILFKAAGAHECATGKFFNLRRFSPSRWGDDSDGRGQLAYWLEESTLAFLRESDIVRVRKAIGESDASARNPFRAPIDDAVGSSQPWVALGWRQYMWWFADALERIDSGKLDVAQAIREADRAWKRLDELDVFMEDRRNDGSWIRPWLRAVLEYRQ